MCQIRRPIKVRDTSGLAESMVFVVGEVDVVAAAMVVSEISEGEKEQLMESQDLMSAEQDI